MEYLSISFRGCTQQDIEILPAFLVSIGFDSFNEEEDRLLAYIPTEQFNEEELKALLNDKFQNSALQYTIETYEDKNWNEIWESNFEAVVIDGKCRVRAPFHDPDPSMLYEIIIEPKMSFGTAHHETTYMMIQLIMDINIDNKELIDMGCGTAVLAILASKRGAKHILAIDNDEWAYRNSLENISTNGCGDIKVLHGDASALPDRKFDIFIANINRNILLSDMQCYVKCIKGNGLLMLSGYYEDDSPLISAMAEKLNLKLERSLVRNRWTAEIYRLIS